MKDIEILKEINLNSKVGMEGIDYCMDKAESTTLKSTLRKQKMVRMNKKFHLFKKQCLG